LDPQRRLLQALRPQHRLLLLLPHPPLLPRPLASLQLQCLQKLLLLEMLL
jgi:hypothetical protein